MANAKKCDRCGSYFDPPNGYTKRYFIGLYRPMYSDMMFDLCPVCRDLLDEWFNSERNDEED